MQIIVTMSKTVRQFEFLSDPDSYRDLCLCALVAF